MYIEQILGYVAQGDCHGQVVRLLPLFAVCKEGRGKKAGCRQFRDEWLNQHWFLNVIEARQVTESWGQEYNRACDIGPLAGWRDGKSP